MASIEEVGDKCGTSEEESTAKKKKSPDLSTVKLMFLDADGVINYSSLVGDGPYIVSAVHMRRVQRIVEWTGCKIVYSTSWRLRKNGIRAFNQAFRDHTKVDPAITVVGKTPSFDFRNAESSKRTWQIRSFLENWEGAKVSQWIAIDDTELRGEGKDCATFLEGHFVMCDSSKGLTDTEVETAIEILNQDQ